MADTPLPGDPERAAPIHRGRRFMVYRLRGEGDDCVVVKRPRPHREDLGADSLRREYEILRSLSGGGVSQPLALDDRGHPPALVLADAGPYDLDRWLANSPTDADTFRSLAPQIARGLARIHRENVVHGELTPANIVVDPAQERVTIVDFDRAFELPVFEASHPRDPAPDLPHEASLPYLAPERTGKAAGPVDHRSDLYSLGATLYRLLTGSPPGDADGTSGARYVPPSMIHPDVPRTIDEILAALLADETASRYSRSHEVAEDLERALGAAQSFPEPPGAGGSARKANPIAPVRRRDRQPERDKLRAALARAQAGRDRAACVISGPPGSGKTMLIDALRRDVETAGGRCLVARCAPPSGGARSPLLDAAAEALRAIFRDCPEERAAAKRRMRVALGSRAPLLASLIPELGELLRITERGPPLGARVPEGDVCLALCDLTSALAPRGAPIALVIDDVHRSDAQTLKLLKGLVFAPASRRWLVIAALAPSSDAGWRRAAAPVEEALAAMQAADPSLTWIELGDGARASARAPGRSELAPSGRRELVAGLKAELESCRRAQTCARWLEDATATIFEPLGHDDVASTLARAFIPDVADICAVDLIDGDGALARKAAADVDPDSSPLLVELTQYEAGWDAPRLLVPPRELEKPVAIPNAAEALARAELDARHREILRHLAVASVLSLPLRSKGRPLGRIHVARRQGRPPFGPHERAAAAELALRASLALERGRYHDELKQSIELRDEFLSIAAHELSTPLTSLKLGIEGIRTGAIPNTQANVSRALDIADRQVASLSQLTGSLLDVSRVRAGTLELDIEPVDIAVLAREVAERLEEEARRAGSEITIRGPASLVGDWDRARLDQIVTNLLSNAIKFGRGAPIALSLEAVDGFSRLSVSDRGIGIPEDKVSAVVHRFVRGVSSRQYDGLGLGLYIVSQLVQALGGALHVESAPGEGSTFTVELPIAGAGRPQRRTETT